MQPRDAKDPDEEVEDLARELNVPHEEGDALLLHEAHDGRLTAHGVEELAEREASTRSAGQQVGAWVAGSSAGRRTLPIATAGALLRIDSTILPVSCGVK